MAMGRGWHDVVVRVAGICLFFLTLVALAPPCHAEEPQFSWRQAPVPPVGVCGAAAVNHEGLILVFGGLDARGTSSVAEARAFDPVSGAWTALPAMPSPRHGHSVVVVDGTVLVVGGVSQQAGGSTRFVRAIDAFDPRRQTWRKAGELPRGRAFFALAVLGERVLLLGGSTEQEKATATVETWDPGLGLWDRFKSLPQGRRGLCAVVVGRRLFVLGGESASGQTLASVLEHDGVGDRWLDAAPMSTPRQDFAAARLGTRIVVAGGCEQKERRRSRPPTTEVYESARNAWVPGGELEPGRDSVAATTCRGKVWLLGGREDERPLRLVSEGAWRMRRSEWRIDQDLRFHLAWFFEEDRILDRSNSDAVRSLGLTPAWGPDINNIMLRDILALGFPFPSRPDVVRFKLYLKLYEYPSTLSALLSSHRVLDGLGVLQTGNGSNLERYLAEPGRVVVKKAVIDAVQGAFDALHPYPGFRVLRAPTMLGGTVCSPQEFFDAHVPFSSLYVKPLQSPPADLPAPDRASLSAQGVNRCREELVEILGRSYSAAPRPVGVPEANTRAPWFLDDSSCDLHLRTECPVRLVRLSDSMVFRNFTGLPMPQDPENLFLSGLLLVFVDDYRTDPSALRQSQPPRMRHVKAHVLEIGSVLRLKGGD